MSYDSLDDTMAHINRVRALLGQVMRELTERARVHDRSKLRSPEKEAFDRVTPRLRELTYGSEEYRASLAEMGVALAHHYAKSRHHPEHFQTGVWEMNLIDVMEMIADWKAATERHDDGDLDASITLNAVRFGYGPEFESLLRNTARDLGWL